MQRINLLYVVTKLELGGAQKQLLALINGLDKAKFRPFLFAAQEGLLLPEALSINELTVIKSKCLERAINPLKDILALLEIRRFIKKNEIKIVHTHSSKAGILGRWAAKLAGVEVILHTVHGWSFHNYQPQPIRLLFKWLERLTARFTDRVIVVSEYDREKGLHNRIGRGGKYALIRYGIDYAEFQGERSGIREELGIGKNDLLVGMVGCFKPQKSPQDFIRLASLSKQRMPDVKFLLVGDGVLRKSLVRLIRRLGLDKEVTLCGWRRDIPSVLSGIDIFVLTSLWEGLPVTVLEAMASLKPVIATDTGGVREVVKDGITGFLVPPKDMNKACERMALLLNDLQSRRRMGNEAGKELAMRFRVEDMVKDTEKAYLEAVANKGGRRAN